jgi:hypothetical protein
MSATPYLQSQIDHSLRAIHALAPTLVQLRLDRHNAPTATSATLDVTLHSTKNRYGFALPLNEAPSSRLIASISGFLGQISHAKVVVLLTELLAIALLNDQGTWVLPGRATTEGRHPLTRTHFQGRPLERVPLLPELLEDLSASLPGVARIVVDARSDFLGNGQQRRRIMLRFQANAQVELAALDTGHFATTNATLICGEPAGHLERNLQRAEGWAAQLGVDVLDLPMIFHDLGLATVQLPIARIELHSEAETAAFWNVRDPSVTQLTETLPPLTAAA